ncbi:MAG: Ig-like domain-containing protein, partial [Dehalococcoidia bacterium]|nr:Ig-like domain-containing protein [Dehalococcoidia bacterium]
MSALHAIATRRRTLRFWQVLTVAVALMALIFTMRSTPTSGADIPNLTFAPDSLEAGATGDVYVTYTNQTLITGAGGRFEFTFPTGFDISDVTIPWHWNVHNAGWLSYTVSGQTVVFTAFTEPLGGMQFDVSPAGADVQIRFAGVRNPTTPGLTDGFSASIAGGQDVGAAPGVMIVPGPPDHVNLTGPANVAAGAQSTDFTLSVVDAYNNETNVAESTAFDLTSDSGREHSFSTGATVTVPGGASTATFTYQDVDAGARNVTATWASGDSSLDGDSAMHAVTVAPGAADHFRITGDGAAVAGVAEQVTVTAYDAVGNVATGYNNASQALTFSGLGDAPLSNGAATTEVTANFSAGTGSAVVAVTGYLAQASTMLHVTDGAVASNEGNGEGLPLVVAHGGADAAKSSIESDRSEIIANGVSTATITVQLRDAFGNDFTTGGTPVCFSTDAGTLSDLATGDCPEGEFEGTEDGDGTYTATLTSSTDLEQGTISATLNGVEFGNTVVEFIEGPPAYVVLSVDEAADGHEVNVTAGDTTKVYITLYDAIGHRADVVGQQDVVFAGLADSPDDAAAEVGGSQFSDGSVTVSMLFDEGQGSVDVEAFLAGPGQTLTVTSVGGYPGAETAAPGGHALTLNVAHADAAYFRLVAGSSFGSMHAGHDGPVDDFMTLRAYDAFGNLADGANDADDTTFAAGTVDVTFSGLSLSPNGEETPEIKRDTDDFIELGQTTALTFSGGVSQDLSFRAYRVGTETLHATAAGLSTEDAPGPSGGIDITVIFESAIEFEVDPEFTTVTAGQANKITLKAVDEFGNVDEDYAGEKNIYLLATNGADDGTLDSLNGTPQPGTFEDGPGAAVTVNFTEGVSDEGNLTLRMHWASENQAPQFVEDGGLSSEFGAAKFTVQHGALDYFLVTTTDGYEIGDQTSGVSFDVWVWAFDAYGNRMDGDNGAEEFDDTVTFSAAPDVEDGHFATGGLDFGTSAGFVEGILVNSLTFTGVSAGAGAGDTRIVVVADGGVEGSSPAIAVQPGALHHFSLGTITSPQTAGVSFNLRIEALDANGNVLSFGDNLFGDDDDETVSLSTNSAFLGVTPTAVGGFVAGVLEDYAVTLTDAGAEKNVGVAGAGSTSGLSNHFTVAPGAASAEHSSLTVDEASPTVGETVTITVTVLDAFANASAGEDVVVYIDNEAYAATGGNLTDNNDGTYTVDFTPGAAGDYEVRAYLGTDDGGDLIDTESIEVSGAAVVANVSLSGFGAGEPVEVTINYTSANPVPADGTIEVTFPAGFEFGTAVEAEIYAGGILEVSASEADQVVTISLNAPVPSGSIAITISGVSNPTALGNVGGFSLRTLDGDGKPIEEDSAFTPDGGDDIVAGPPSTLTSTAAADVTTVNANGVGEAMITVTVKDRFGNPVQDEVVSVSGEGDSDVSCPGDALTDGDGVIVFTVTNAKVENLTYTFTAEGVRVGQATVNFVLPQPSAVTSTIMPPAQSVVADGADEATITVTVRDSDGVAVPNAALIINKSSALTAAPDDATADANGVYVLNVTSTTADTVTYTFDAVSGSLGTSQVTFTPGAPSGAESLFAADRDSVQAGGTVTLTITLRDAFGNRLGADGDGTEVVIYLGDPDAGGEVLVEDVTDGYSLAVTHTQGTPGTVTFYAFFGTNAARGTAIGTVEVTFTSPEPPADPDPTPTPTPTPSGTPVPEPV